MLGKYFLAIYLLVQFSSNEGFTDNFFNNPELVEEYDKKLSEFLWEILENFRDQMPNGIPEIDVPVIDPLVIEGIDKDIEEDVAKVTLMMRNVSVEGISQFTIEDLKADLDKRFFNISLRLPNLRAEGYCYMDGKVLGIFPIRSDGPFYIQVQQVTIEGHGDLNVTRSDQQIRLHMNTIRMNLDFGPLDIQFESLLGGGRWTQVLVKLLSGVGRQIFLRFRSKAMETLDSALLNLVNQELDKGTLNDILDQIPLKRSVHH